MNEQIVKYLNIIIDEVNRLDELSQKLLDYAGESYLKIEKVNINNLLLKVLFLGKLNKLQAGIKIEESLAADLPLISGDKELLSHALMNLFMNAMEAIADEGYIKVNTFKDEEGAVIKIADSGIGIPAERFDRIFDPFYTDKDNGTGLGLSVTHKIITDHGGHIDVESEVGAGTTFTVKLPGRRD
jgi:signal transduction histidine kinase